MTFSNSYFENHRTKVASNQLFVLGSLTVTLNNYNTFNLVALKESQSVFIRIPHATSGGVIFKKNFRILCPQGYKISPQSFCKDVKSGIKCYYVNIQCEQCSTKAYTIERGELIFNTSNTVECHQCPREGNCDIAEVTAKPNFWGHKIKKKVLFFQCPPGYCCRSDDCIAYAGCHGNRSGTLCGQCPEGLFSTNCIPNTECSLNYLFILGIIVSFAQYLVFFVYETEIVNFFRTRIVSECLSFLANDRNRERNNFGNALPSDMIKIFFYYYQVCNLLRSCTGSSAKGPFIQNFENAISRVVIPPHSE